MSGTKRREDDKETSLKTSVDALKCKQPRSRRTKKGTAVGEQRVPFHLSLSFIEPAEYLADIIRKFGDSPDENRRAVAKAMNDVSVAGAAVREAMIKKTGCDMAPYLDFWFADALESARKLLQYDDAESRDLGQALIDAEKSVIESKESVLAEIKRLGLKRGNGGAPN